MKVKSVLSLVLLFSFILGSGNVYAKPAVDKPKGWYEVVKTYEEGDPAALVENEDSDQSPKIKTQTEEKADRKVTKERKTRKYRELENKETGETATQYVTDYTETVTLIDKEEKKVASFMQKGRVSAFMGDDETDTSGSVKFAATIYYTKYKEQMYIGLDSVTTNHTILDSSVSIYKMWDKIFQTGPGLDGYAQHQDKEVIYVLYNWTHNVTNWGWVPVMEKGVMTQVGVLMKTTMERRSSTWTHTFGIMIEGAIPSWPG